MNRENATLLYSEIIDNYSKYLRSIVTNKQYFKKRDKLINRIKTTLLK